jgi:tetratricopeptide (TPR) repeat protein
MARCLGLLFVVIVAFVGCGKDRTSEVSSAKPPTASPAELKNEIPPDQLSTVLKANRLGIGLLEQFEYAKAAEQFRIVRKLAPGWIAGSINLSIALLNDSGVKAEDQKKSGSEVSAGTGNFQEALALLDDVIKRFPDNLHAHYCRGIILQFLMADPQHPENLIRAHDDFKFISEADPTDSHVWYKLAETLYDPSTRDNPNGPRMVGPEILPKKIEYLNKALEQNPYLASALHQLHLSYAQSGDRATQAKLIVKWRRLNPLMNTAAPGEVISNLYGSMGRYAQAIDPSPDRQAPQDKTPPPRFDVPTALDITLPAGHRWAKASDFTDKHAVFGRARARFGAAVAVLDLNGDGKLDLFLAASVVGPNGLRDALLVNKGEGRFEDATDAFHLPTDRVSLGVAAADFDADRRVDLFLTGVGDNRLLRNTNANSFEDVTKAAGIPGSTSISPTARWMDLDQDGDLDLYVINYSGVENVDLAFTEKTPPGAANTAFRNDGTPPRVPNHPADNWAPIAAATFAATAGLSLDLKPWPDAPALGAGLVPHTGLAMLDLDDDRDIDIVVSADGQVPTALVNDRLGAFRSVQLDKLGTAALNGLLATDLDKDGRIDLVGIGNRSKVAAWRNRSTRSPEGIKGIFEVFPCDARSWRTAVAEDLDLDTWTDLVGLPSDDSVTRPVWARNRETKLVPLDMAVAPDGDATTTGMALADLVGDPLPDLLSIRDGEAPRLARNLGNGQHWVAIGLGGRWKIDPDHMRTNSEGLGTRITIEGEGLEVEYTHTTPSSGLAQSATPVVLGLGNSSAIQLLHLRWPDGVLQCELNLPVDTTHRVAEYNRKTGSCPVLFTWNGERFVCLGDFLGGGGLGYLVAPGVYGQPDRDEAVAIAPGQLKAVDGRFRLAVTEPMDEIAYLDKFVLEVVDRPPGIQTTPDERFAPNGRRPTGELIAWSKTVEPVKASDQAGRDLTETLRRWDRATADGFRRLRGWIGYAEDHAITLDFGDRLKSFGSSDRLVLCLAGWVEYPYSQTNYAAATAGTSLKPPVLERLGSDGKWVVIDPDPGYPAGLPRMMTVDLTGKVSGPSCVLRIRTNMECYWDQAFIAVRDDSARLKTTSLTVTAASLGYRGYTREISPDGRLPLLYDYDYIDPAPLARLAGNLTRYGDVARLLQSDDDQLCLVGPGDEVRLEFDARSLASLPTGWTRSFVLRSIGYCKDADPFTATSDHVGPLPWKGMPEFPFKHGETRPADPSYDAYLREFQTRATTTR